jgi:hypothetical protein
MSRWRQSVASGAARRFQLDQQGPRPTRAIGSLVDPEIRALVYDVLLVLENPEDGREQLARLVLRAHALLGDAESS